MEILFTESSKITRKPEKSPKIQILPCGKHIFRSFMENIERLTDFISSGEEFHHISWMNTGTEIIFKV